MTVRSLRGRLLAAALLALSLACLICWSAPAHAVLPTETYGPAPSDAAAAMLVIHGGGWQGGALDQMTMARSYAQRYADTTGMLARSIDYPSNGPAGYQAVISDYDELRAQLGPDKPICATGYSAGGHLALMLAQVRDVACVIADGAPTNLITISPYIRPFVSAAFGYDLGVLRQYSPVFHTDQIRAPVLMINAANDPVIVQDQYEPFVSALPNTELIVLDAGDRSLWHVHSSVDGNQLRGAWERSAQFALQQAQAWRDARAAARVVATAPAPQIAAPAPTATPQPARPAAPAAKAKTRKVRCVEARAHKKTQRCATARAKTRGRNHR